MVINIVKFLLNIALVEKALAQQLAARYVK